jgi:excisionase family DNA binding protein
MKLSDDVLHEENVIAKQLKCDVKTLQAWRSRGGGPPFVKVGRLVRYRAEDVKAWVESRRKRSTSESVSNDAA